MEKKRLFYLDFIRAIATVAIILTHYNARYIYSSPQLPEKMVLTATVGNIYIGDWGVSLFFIISGAALMYIYQEKIDIKKFFKKRFMAVYPMFWLAYTIAFLMLFYINKGMIFGAPKPYILLSLVGFDGYLSSILPTFYILGEWFLGAIILIYAIFPILRKMVNEHPKILFVSIVLIYIYMLFFYTLSFNKALIIFTRIPEIALGMYFVKYITKVNIFTFVISSLIILLNIIFKPTWDSSFQTTYIGIASFFVLVYVSKYIRIKLLKEICSSIGKYSYSIFLVHHVVISNMMATFNLAVISKMESYILFLACCLVTFILAYLLYKLNSLILCKIRKVYE